VLIGWDQRSCARRASVQPSLVLPPALSCHWPQGQRVEQYVSRNDVTLSVAKLFAGGQRSAVVIWGPEGIGKTAFCREFCHYYSAPGGRLYSTAALFVNAQDFRRRPKHAESDDGTDDGDEHPALANCGCRPADVGTGGLGAAAADGDAEHREHLARAILAELAERGPKGGRIGAHGVAARAHAAMGKAASGARWETLLDLAHELDDMGRWLLVVDGLPEPEKVTPAEKLLVKALQELLDASGKLRVLLTSRGQWKRLVDRKIVGVRLQPLAPKPAAVLFARNIHRVLRPDDFAACGEAGGSDAHGAVRSGASTSVAPYPPSSQLRGCGGSVDASGPQPLRIEAAIDLLRDSPLLRALGGVPGRLIEAADEVDERLPSLLRHPFLGAPPAPD